MFFLLKNGRYSGYKPCWILGISLVGWAKMANIHKNYNAESLKDFVHMDVSENIGTPKKSSILVGFFHYFHHPFWGTPIFGNTHISHLYLPGLEGVLNTTPILNDSTRLARRLPQMPPAKHLTR